MVEKLIEETASNDQHLRHLISICEGNLGSPLFMFAFLRLLMEVDLVTVVL